PAKVGGTSHIPIASLRLKMIREGMEDYEYLKLLADSGDVAMADAEAAALSPHSWQNQTDPAAIDAARHRIAVRIEPLTGQTPMDSGGTGGNAPADGTGGNGGGGSHGCSYAAGVRPIVTPLSLVLVALGVLGWMRRRRQQRAGGAAARR